MNVLRWPAESSRGDYIVRPTPHARRERARAADNIRTKIADLNAALAHAADLGLTVDIRQIPSGTNLVAFTTAMIAEFLPVSWGDGAG